MAHPSVNQTAQQGNASSLSEMCTNCTTNISSTAQHHSVPNTNCAILCVVCVVIYILIILVATLGNILIVYAFAWNRKIRKAVTTYFIVSLAISDLFTATVVMPFDLEQILTNYHIWRHSAFVCTVWTTLFLLMVPSSILNLLVLTVDRYKTLSDPLNRFKESPFMTKRRALLVIAFLWSFCLLFALIPVMGWKEYPEVIIDGQCVFNISPIYSMLSSVLNFIIPLVVMCALYFKIYRIAINLHTNLSVGQLTSPSRSPRTQPRDQARDQDKRASKSRSKKIKDQKMLLKNTRTAKTVLLIVLTFVLCWMPHTLYSFIGNIACNYCYYAEGDTIITAVFLIMGYANSALNPFLFGFHHRLFKRTFQLMFQKLTMKCYCRRLPSPRRSPGTFLYRITDCGSVKIHNPSQSHSEQEIAGDQNLGASLTSIKTIVDKM